MAVIIDGTLGVTTPTGTGDVSVGDDLIFTGTGNRITGDFSNATFANRVMFQTSTANSATAVEAIPNGTNTNSSFTTYNNSDPTNASFIQIGARDVTDGRIESGRRGSGTFLPMTFHTGGSERVRIDTSGNVGIGTSSPGSKLDVNGELRATSTRGAGSGQDAVWLTASGVTTTLLLGDSVNSGNGIVQYDRSLGNTLVRSGGSGGVVLNAGATSWVAASDERIKDIIEPITNAVEKVVSLRAVIGKYKSDEKGTRRSFLIAQDVQSVLPEAVIEVDEIKTLGIAYTDTIPLLVAAIKEQQAIIKSLQDRITALEQA